MALAVELERTGQQSSYPLQTPAAAPDPPTAQHVALTDEEFNALKDAIPTLFQEITRHLITLGQMFGVQH